MRFSLLVLASLASSLPFAAPAFAQESPPREAAPASPDSATTESPRSGLQLGVRTGFALPFGSIARGTSVSMRDVLDGQIPILLDAGYRITPNWYVGAYGAFGINLISSDLCAGTVTCNSQTYRVGANVHYHVLPSSRIDPWVGVGAGYEWLTVSAGDEHSFKSGTERGFELVNLQIGGDVRLSRTAYVGPFASFSLNQFSTDSVRYDGGGSTSQSIDEKALHEWLTFGVRGRFDL